MPIQRRGMRALQIWCQRVTATYDNVDIIDLTTSFRDGLAFCAIIHHFRPDLIPNFDELKSENILENNKLAYEIAESKLEIPSLLDPQDMVDCADPDKFSVVTYLSQFYHLFKDADGSRNSPDVNMHTTLRNSPSSESENDSLLSSSESNTPLGTPTTSRPAHKTDRLFNQADLIAKYGEEIFSTSDSAKKQQRTAVGAGGGNVARLCSEFTGKARI